MADEQTPKKSGYSKMPLWQKVLIYVVVGGAAYYAIYYFFLSNNYSY